MSNDAWIYPHLHAAGKQSSGGSMARGDQLARQWKIIQRLSVSRRGKTVRELAQNLDCHLRTLYRDLEALEAAGFPICIDRTNGTNRWSLMEGARNGFALPVSLPELMALYFGRDLLKPLSGTVFHDSLDTLFRKIKAVLAPDTLNYLGRIERCLRAGREPHKAYGPLKHTLDALGEAVLKRSTVDILYFTLSRNKVTRRRVDPYALWFHGGTFYLIGRCHLKKCVLVFAVDRIRSLEATGDTFIQPADFDAERFMETSFGVFQGEPVKVKILFAPDAAGYVLEKTWHPSQKVAVHKDGSVLFEAEVAGTREIKLWVLRWGSKAQVLAPQSLREEIRIEAAEMLAHYTDDVRRVELSLAG
jgi:predicted DNA-binding transcriptional regulator YafY